MSTDDRQKWIDEGRRDEIEMVVMECVFAWESSGIPKVKIAEMREELMEHLLWR